MLKVGREIETIVQTYLEKQGLIMLEANYQCRFGEIDLIMRDRTTLVFIEVRYRKQDDYGDGAASVDTIKQNKIKKTAANYLYKHRLADQINCRFDIVAVSGTQPYQIHWITDAFWQRW